MSTPNIDDRELDIPIISEVCVSCKHATGYRRCVAFPEEIPLAIWTGKNDHTKPYSGDNGVRYERMM